MPIIKSAKKKVRKDKKRTAKNSRVLSLIKDTFKKLKKNVKSDKKLLGKYYSLIDKAVKTKVIHKNKSQRLKSAAGKLAIKK